MFYSCSEKSNLGSGFYAFGFTEDIMNCYEYCIEIKNEESVEFI